MPIKFVANGYFRSGTTFLWNYFRAELQEKGALGLYEPLNPDLALLVRGEARSSRENKLHKMRLFDDYLVLGDDFLRRVLLDNPNANGFGIHATGDLTCYLDLIHSINRDVFLQTNRLHFYLDTVAEKYTRRVLHVIRNPISVWRSVRRTAYALVDSPLKRLIHFALRPLKFQDAYEIRKNFLWIVRKVGYPQGFRNNISVVLPWRVFDKFVVTWVVSNYFALKSIERFGGLFFPYEFMVDEPLEFARMAGTFLGELLKPPPVLRSGGGGVGPREYGRLEKVMDVYDIRWMFDYVDAHLCREFGIKYTPGG